ncbi:hypothetical protein LXL04_005913 [Taraxacum kok-saghyz]
MTPSDASPVSGSRLSKGSPLSPAASVSNIGIRQKRIRSSSVVGNLSANLNEAPMFDDPLRAHTGLYQWLVTEEARIFETFKNVAKNRFRDVICEARDASALAAKKAGFDMPPNTKDFSIMVDFPPDWIEGEVWKALCEIWNTNSWKKNSQTAKSNRKSSVSGSISTHTGGSINTEQHRAKMKKENGIDPTWGAVFKQTHLEKSAKLKLAAGESIGSKPEDWAAMCGGKKKGKVYGVGSSDPSYAVSGLSGGYDCGSSNQEHALSQKVIELESRLEKDRLEREEMEARFEREVKERKDMEARFNIQMLEVVKKFTENGKVAMDRLNRIVSDRPVVIFSKSSCIMSHTIKSLLNDFGVNPTVYELDQIAKGREIEQALMCGIGCSNMPIVFIGGELIGGANEIMSLQLKSVLKPMLIRAGALWV